jgi:hypothetical protein
LGKIKFNIEHKKVLDEFLLKTPGVVSGKMFGYPAYYIQKKLFAVSIRMVLVSKFLKIKQMNL